MCDLCVCGCLCGTLREGYQNNFPGKLSRSSPQPWVKNICLAQVMKWSYPIVGGHCSGKNLSGPGTEVAFHEVAGAVPTQNKNVPQTTDENDDVWKGSCCVFFSHFVLQGTIILLNKPHLPWSLDCVHFPLLMFHQWVNRTLQSPLLMVPTLNS